jgi:hypothetical protein
VLLAALEDGDEDILTSRIGAHRVIIEGLREVTIHEHSPTSCFVTVGSTLGLTYCGTIKSADMAISGPSRLAQEIPQHSQSLQKVIWQDRLRSFLQNAEGVT